MDHNFATLSKAIPDEASAYELLEQLRWKGRPVCPHCASVAEHYFLTPKGGARKTRTGAVSHRRVWCCRDCRKQFSVLNGTIFSGSKIPIRTWLLVTYEMAASKNGLAAREVQRKYGLSPKSAWFMCHRIREAMRREPFTTLLSGTVVADETWWGGHPKNKHYQDRPHKQGVSTKTPILSLLSAETGEVRSRVIPNVRSDTLASVIRGETDIGRTTLHTDEQPSYKRVAKEAAGHGTVDHRKNEYVRDGISTNKLENFFSQLKRSVNGTFHHVSEDHLQRYLDEFDYRASTRELTDGARMARVIDQAAGRRLTYRPVGP